MSAETLGVVIYIGGIMLGLSIGVLIGYWAKG